MLSENRLSWQPTPPGAELSATSLVIPPEIRAAAPLLRKTKRFLDPRYPRGVIIDNVLDHERRCVLADLNLSLPETYANQLIQTHWWHDYPEAAVVHGFDSTAVQKAERPELGRVSDEQELAAAKRLLSAEGLELFEGFQEAERFLRGHFCEIVNPIAVLAKIIDFVDGNLVFHHFISRWANSGRRRKILPATALEYTFVGSSQYQETIKRASFFPYIKDVCLATLADQVSSVKEMWHKVEPSQVPPPIAKFIS